MTVWLSVSASTKACHTPGWNLPDYKGIDPTGVKWLGRRCDDLVVIDCDDADAVAWWLEHIGLPMGHTYTVKTAKGHHFYYKFTPGSPTRTTNLRPEHNVDIKAGRGALVVAPPSPGKKLLHDVDVMAFEAAWLPTRTASDGRTGVSHLADLLENKPSADKSSGWNDWLTQVCGHYAKRFRDVEDAYRAQVALAADSLDGQWESGEVNKIATSVWEREQSKVLDDDFEVRDVLRRLKVTARARELFAQEQFAETSLTLPMTLTQELALPDEQVFWTIKNLHERGMNSLLTGAFKVGKTTFMANLVRSLADGTPFLGTFDTHCEGAVLFLNYEVGAGQFRRWLRKLNVQNTDRIIPWNLRGQRLPFWTPEGAAQLVRTCEEYGVSFIIADPWARAFGGEENSNSEVSRALEALDEVKLRAGVDDLLVSAHTGRTKDSGEDMQTRAATRLDDWPDSLWRYSKDAHGMRSFSATGRDIEVSSFIVSFDSATHEIQATGTRSEHVQVMKDIDEQTRRMRIKQVLKASPGITTVKLEEACGGKATAHRATRTRMVNDGKVHFEYGPRSAKFWHLSDGEPSMAQDSASAQRRKART